MSEKCIKSEDEWRRQLTEEQFEVTRRKATERAFTGQYHDCKDEGVYACVCCGNELFGSNAKYDSGSGWPSFTEPISPEQIDSEEDTSIFMRRTEVLCRHCAAHLGHVFDDGPGPTGKRFCINSAALKLRRQEGD